MRVRIAAMAAAALVSTASATQADVTYSFVNTSAAYTGPYPIDLPPLGFSGSIDLPDATVASGSFDLAGGFSTTSAGAFSAASGGQGKPVTASYSTESGAFNSVQLFGVTATPTSRYGSINLHLTFGQDGAITSSTFSGSTYDSEFTGSGTGDAVSGYLGSDAPGCDASAASHYCAFTGYFVETVAPGISAFGAAPDPVPGAARNPVPEPATLALLAASLLGTAAVRRRSG